VAGTTVSIAGNTADTSNSDGLETTRIHVAKDGHFGVVVVGSSMADEYPETVEVWGSRLIYTVYLHVGTRRNWILQYALPRGADAAAAGNDARPEAPWPYDIVRPDLKTAEYNSDALMVHGIVNAAGRFERLAMVFPSEFARAKFVLDAMQQWQFRPAAVNGKQAAVEVLVIIPEQTD
jgi:hypothetical protein